MNTEALREAAILDYKAAAAGERVSFDYDYVFMETCIDAGYSMDEAVDAALQKFKLYMSQEAKLCKRIGKEIKANVKKKNYPEAIALAKKRLAHLENLLKRADEEIDDDEDFIISMESMAKSVIITMIVSAILVKVAEGIVPGSGWLLDAVKKGAKAVKIKAGKDGSFLREFIDPILTIAGISKMVSKPIASHKMKKWQKERDGDINREYNEGRPDTTTLSVSRVQAKTRFKKLIQAQKDEIRMLEEAQKLHNKPKNESVELDEGFFKFGKKAKRDDKYSSLASAAQKAYNKKFIGPDEFISEARKRCPISKGDYTNDDQILDALAESMSKSVRLPSFAKLVKSHNEAIKEYEALDKAKFNGSDSYIVKVSEFAIDNDGEYINFSSSNQFVNSMFAETFEKLANALLSDAGIKRRASTGDGDEGAIYLDESIGLDEGVSGFFIRNMQNKQEKRGVGKNKIKTSKSSGITNPAVRKALAEATKQDARREKFYKWLKTLSENDQEAFCKAIVAPAAECVKKVNSSNKRGVAGFMATSPNEAYEVFMDTGEIQVFTYDIYDFYNDAKIDYRDSGETAEYWADQNTLVNEFKKIGIEIYSGDDWDSGGYYIVNVSDELKRKYLPKVTSVSDRLNEGASLDSLTNDAFVSFGFSALLLAGALAVRHFSEKRKEAIERKVRQEQERERAKKATATEEASIRSAIMIANGNYDVKMPTNIDKLKCAGCSAENAEKYFQKLLSKNPSDLSEVEKFIDDAESVDYPDETMISAVKKHMNNPIYVIDVEGSYSITLYDAKTGKVHSITFADGEETEDFKSMYNKYVVPTDLRKYYTKKINEIKQSSRKVVRENTDIIVEASILLKSGFRGTREEVLQEAKLKAAARNDLPDSDFGLPEDRKYPLNDAAHVKAAIKMFSHCPNDKKAKLAKRITAAMDKFGINTKFKKDSPLYNYVSAKYRAE